MICVTTPVIVYDMNRPTSQLESDTRENKLDSPMTALCVSHRVRETSRLSGTRIRRGIPAEMIPNNLYISTIDVGVPAESDDLQRGNTLVDSIRMLDRDVV